MTISITSNLADIHNAKTSELLAFYNAHRNPIQKFRDRATAERRVADLIQELIQAKATTVQINTPTSSPIQAVVMNAASTKAKTYMVVIRDHSGSMHSLREPAKRDFNGLIGSTKKAAEAHDINTVVSVYECGGGIRRAVTLTPVQQVQLLQNYNASGGTPLFESVLQAIDHLRQVPDYNDPEVTFIVAATTDGQSTDQHRAAEMMRQIREHQATDRWTFVFRVPRGYARDLVKLGVEPGNVLEWDQTERGFATAAAQNDQAVSDFFQARSTGQKSTRTFYTSVANITEADVKKLGDISSEVQLFPVASKEEGAQIRDFVEARLNGSSMLKGAAFYQLVKTEDKIQDYKLIAIRDKETGQIFCGPEARDLIGLPRYGDARVRPDTAGKWQVFVQSTSVNRKVNANTSLLYWPNVGKRFTEGKSAR